MNNKYICFVILLSFLFYYSIPAVTLGINWRQLQQTVSGNKHVFITQ